MFFIPQQQAIAFNLRAENHVRHAAFTEEPPQRHFRLTNGQFDEITAEYHLWRARNGDVQLHRSEQRMNTFLAYLASGGYYRQIGHMRGIAKSTAFLHTRDVADFFMHCASNHISLPRPEEFQQLSLPLRDVQGQVQNVILYIDGFIIRIQRPDHAGDAYFCGRHGKSCDAINVQYIVDKNGTVRHVITGIPGPTHDKTATEWSDEFMTFLDTLPQDVVVLGDPAYRRLHRAVVHPFTGHNLDQQQQNYNLQSSRLRQIVERSIGATQLKWRMEQMKENRYPARKGPLFAAKCSIACAVLHNRFTNYL